ncbi:hypothetical protein [Ramlibacter tataouinensis]|uniref:hypothetical protein n=1 Tax=Ramlibacter tataouinensis TaxID=94132 RepID=UPI0011AEBF75|nr:hypothetical protein [Ramlibacter tataouinensis]
MNFKSSSTRPASLALAAFAASLVVFAGAAAAGANCPQGATCKCVTTVLTDCTAGPNGKLTCTRSNVLDCTVVSGPGSGKTSLVQPAFSPSFSPLQRR